MRFPLAAICALAIAGGAWAQTKPVTPDFEMMTWVEVKAALAAGKTTALVFNGGTEQRGPQNVNGGHTFIARHLAVEIAEKLGNAIAAPVLPYSVNNASAVLPGTIGLTGELFAAINEQVAEQLIKTGFKNVVLMGDHGGGQKEMSEVAKKLDAKYSPQGIHVVWCNDVYDKVDKDFNKWLTENHYTTGTHAGIKDTSELLYIEGGQGYVRKDLIPTAVTDEKKSNGISGDARKSSVEIGRRISEMKADYAVAQIKKLLAAPAASAQQ